MSEYENPQEYNEYLEKVVLELDDYNERIFRQIIKLIRNLKSQNYTKNRIYTKLKTDLRKYEDFSDDEILLPLLEKEGLI